ncbi:MAG: protein kinase [Candidatus Acidiferrum sp.]|jgi:serine/threonine-protein kinase
MIGQTIAHYRVTEKLGAGGMGVVYKATDLKLERTVALKFLPHDTTINAHEKERLWREARAASSLDHANIGVIYGLEEAADGQIFIVMGYYQGETLAQKIARGLLSVSDSVNIAMQIASGLAAAHARNIVHRDIKPSNVIVTNDRVVKIVDFGLARLASTASATHSITTTGTLPYMAPEQILGEAIDQRSDVWALGVILVQMLTGSHPFLRPNTGAMTFAILNQPPAAIDAVVPLLQPIVLRALSKQPAHRYAGGREILGDLEAARAQLSGTVGATEPPTATRAVNTRELEEFMAHATTPRWTGPQATASEGRRYNGLKTRAWVYTALGALTIALLAAALFFSPATRQAVAGLFAGSGGEKHIAVLPIDNADTDPANAAVADGLMDSLTGKLSNLDETQRSLWVVPASVVRSRKITDPAAAYHDLGATMVVKGKIQRTGQAVQLTVDLINAKDLRQIGSATIEDAAGDLAALQNDAVARLARMMNIRVSADTLRAEAVSAAPTSYEGYLKALGYIQRYDKPGNLDLAITALQAAVQTDPRFALGYAELGEAYRLKNQVDPNPKWITEASANLQRASQLDDHLATTYVSLGMLHTSLSQNDLAQQEFEKALQINPRDASALSGLARNYEHMGRTADAEATFKKAVALRPDYWDGYNSLGWFYLRQERKSAAIAQFRHVIELTPDNAAAWSNLASAYLSVNDAPSRDEAEKALQKSLTIAPTYAAYANLGVLYLDEKRYKDSAETTQKALELNAGNYLVWDNLRIASEWMKDDALTRNARDKTLALLEPYALAHPQDATAQALLAKMYAGKGEHEKAVQHISAALELAPKDSDVMADTAETYEMLGERDKALSYAKASLAAGTTPQGLAGRPALQSLLQAIEQDKSFRSSGKN